ncbi:MAG: hypothetical protein ABSB89_06760 [Candidatus Bathyarchaeia archaeon]
MIKPNVGPGLKERGDSSPLLPRVTVKLAGSHSSGIGKKCREPATSGGDMERFRTEGQDKQGRT